MSNSLENTVQISVHITEDERRMLNINAARIGVKANAYRRALLIKAIELGILDGLQPEQISQINTTSHVQKNRDPDRAGQMQGGQGIGHEESEGQ